MIRKLILLLSLCLLVPLTAVALPVMDGSFDDWQGTPASRPEANNGAQYRIRQARWQLSEDLKTLYLMAELSQPADKPGGTIATNVETEFGSFTLVTSYDSSDGTALSTMDGAVLGETGACRRIGSGSVFLEYPVPLGQSIPDPRWQYKINFCLETVDDRFPADQWISMTTSGIVSENSDRAPTVVWILAVITAGIILLVLLRRRRKKR